MKKLIYNKFLPAFVSVISLTALHTAHSHQHDTHPEALTVVSGWGESEGTDHEFGMGATHGGIVVDQSGLIYVSSHQGIFVFNDAGKIVKTYQGPEYADIHAMILHVEKGTEFIYGARNTKAEVVKLKTDGHVVMTIPFPEESGLNMKHYKPTAVLIKPDGHILVADGYGSNVIFEFDQDGTYLSNFGGKDLSDPKKFKTPHGLTLDHRYDPVRLLISDREKKRLVHFDLNGTYIGEVITGLRRPCSVSIRGSYVAVAELQGRVVILNEKNEIVKRLGDNPNQDQWAKFKVPTSDWKEGIFTAPHGICWDHHGNLYVQDWNESGRVSKWTP